MNAAFSFPSGFGMFPSQGLLPLLQLAAASALQASLTHPSPPIIQPNLETTAKLDQLKRRFEILEDELKTRDRPGNDEDEVLGEKDQNAGQSHRRKRPRNEKEMKKYLDGPVYKLSSAQKTIRNELANFVKEEIISAAGDIDYYLTRSTPNDDGNNKKDDGKTTPGSLFDFNTHVLAASNWAILEHAARMVTKSQSPTAETCKLSIKTVKWTYDDVLDLCKSRFRAWKLRFSWEMDAGKAAKREQQNKRNKRGMRKRHLKTNRLKAVELYKKEYDKDPTPFLESDWMSSEVSELDTDNEESKIQHRNMLVESAGLNPKDVEEVEPVWEVVKPVWRSERVDKIYAELDTICREQRRKSNTKRTHQLIRRVNLGRKSNEDQRPWPMIFPCMLDTAWYQGYLNGKPDEGVFTRPTDPDDWKVEEGPDTEDSQAALS